MKRILLASMLVTAGLSLMAQSVDKAKSSLEHKKLPDAKMQIDKVLENPKKANDAEAWYIKAKIYVAISKDSALSSTVPDAKEQAFAALKMYISLDKKDGGKLILMQIDQYKPVYDLYSDYYKAAAAFYNVNNFNDAFITFKKCLEVGDTLIANKWTTMKFDTSVVLYTGISAAQSNNKDTAAAYYTKLTDRKIVGPDKIQVYKWLTSYYYEKKDTANTQKFINLGKELYPNDNYWSNMELDIASNQASSGGDKTALYKKYEEMMAKEPNNSVYPYNYGVELYKQAYAMPTDSITGNRSAGSQEIITKAEGLLQKSLEIKPDNMQVNIALGQMLYNDAVEFNKQERMFKPGIPNSKLTPEEIKQKEELKSKMLKKFDDAIPYLEKVGNTLGSQGKLKPEDRSALKDAYDLLTTIYDNKQNKAKMEEYQNKFNDVDKLH